MSTSSDTPNQLSDEPDSAWFRYMHAVDRFDERWQTAGDAAIAEFLPAEPGDARRELLIELIKVDLEYRWRRGERTHIERYLQQFPELGDVATVALELIVEELQVRATQGSASSDDELAARFPGRVAELRAALECGGSTPLSSEQAHPSESETILPPNQGGVEPPHSKADGTRSVPATLGRYELREQVGHGGFAIVWRAYDPELRREVAIKVPRPELIGAPGFRERIEREVQAAARLRHPAIVPIYEVGHAGDGTGEGHGGGITFIVYEFVAGPTLAKLLETTETSPRQAAEWMAVLSEGLDYAHQNGIVHRDIKPANILLAINPTEGNEANEANEKAFTKCGASSEPLSSAGPSSLPPFPSVQSLRPMLTDFGLALHADAGATLTQQGDILGTPAYMSPEQARGEGHSVDPRTDVYSLGVMLYEMLAGRRPFEGSGVSVLQRVIDEDPPALRSVRPGVPLDLETICQRAMAKELSRRYRTAGAMAADLRAWLEHRPIQARRVGAFGRFSLWCRRKPALAATIAAAAIVSLAVASVSFVRVVAERNRFRAERDRASAERDRAEANLYDALVSDASAQMAARRTGWWWKAMDDLRGAARLDVPGKDRDRLRELAIECIGTAYPCMRLAGEWSGHDGPVQSVAFTSDGRVVASGSRDKTVRVWSVPDGRLLTILTGHDEPVLSVEFHPSGDRLASSDAGGSIRVWSIGSVAEPAESSQSDRSPTRERGLNRDLESKSSTPSLARRATVEREFHLGPGPLRQIEYSPDGRWLAAAAADGTIRLLPLVENAEPRGLTGHTAEVLSLSFYGNGDMLLSGSADNTLRLWNVATGRTISSWGSSSVGTTPNAVVADKYRDLAAYWGASQTFGVEMKRLQSGHVSWQFHLHSATITQIDHVFSTLLTASADGEIKLISAVELAEQAVAQSEHAVRSARFGSDGRWVAAGYHDGRVRLWEVYEPAERRMSGADSQRAVFLGPDRRATTGITFFDFSAGLDASPQNMTDVTSDVACHPDGRRAFCGLSDGTVHLWDLHERSELRQWPGHSGPIGNLAVSPDGRRVATGGWDGMVKVWNSDSFELEQSINPGTGKVHQLAWTGDGSTLVVIGKCGALLLRASGEPIAWIAERYHHGYRYNSVVPDFAMAAANASVAIGTPDGPIELRSAATGEIIRLLEGHKSIVRAVTFSSDGRRLASVAADKSVRIWEVETGVEQARFEIEGTGAAWLAFDPRGRHLAVSGSTETGVPTIWSLTTNQPVATIGCIGSTAGHFKPDGRSLLVALHGGVTLFDLAALDPAAVPPARDLRANDVALSRSATIAPSATATLPHFLPSATLHEGISEGRIWGVAASPDGRWFATAGHDRLVKIWDARSRRVVRTLRGHGDIVWCLAFSADSRTLASGSADSSGKVGQIKLWDVATGRQLHQFDGHSRLVLGLDFHPSGKLLASSSSDGSVHLWDTERLEPLGELHKFDQSIYSVAFRPDGRVLAASCLDNRVAVWELPDLKSEISNPRSQISDFKSRPPGRLLSGHTSAVYSVAWSPDGRYLASGSERGVVIFWDGDTFDRVVTLKGGTGQIRHLSFSRDGELLACGAYAAPLLVWDLVRFRGTLRGMNLDW